MPQNSLQSSPEDKKSPRRKEISTLHLIEIQPPEPPFQRREILPTVDPEPIVGKVANKFESGVLHLEIKQNENREKAQVRDFYQQIDEADNQNLDDQVVVAESIDELLDNDHL